MTNPGAEGGREMNRKSASRSATRRRYYISSVTGTQPPAGRPAPAGGCQERLPAEDYLDGATTERFFAVGRHSHGVPFVPIYKGDDAGVQAGAFLWIEGDVELQPGGNHRIDWVTTFPLREIYGLAEAYVELPWSKGDIVIGNGVMLGRGSRVLSGVTIGDGALVAPYSVVTRDVPPYMVVAGHPACDIGRRFSAGVTAVLERISWWEWPDSIVQDKLEEKTGSEALELIRQLSEGPESTMPSRPALLPRVRRAASMALAGLAQRLHFDSPPVAPAVAMGVGSYGLPSVDGPVEDVGIGSYSSIADDTTIVVTHRAARAVAQGLGNADGPPRRVDIGNDVWIGRGARILPGVTIGDGAVIGAFSVVSEDVRPYAVVVGNPAREVRRRFDDATVRALLRIRWWDWPNEQVLARCSELCSDDLVRFVARYDPLSRG